ncbi:DNA cytosine methyltransferase [Mycobacterium gordonae]|uniref:DNA cytosine methyltransferase n=1 Tax=Mycobacterium gordonae TaxID=1778 RepID=UPI003557EF73
MNVVGQVEINPFCRKVLAKHWPDVPRHDDVRTAVEWWESEPRPDVDLICGGFPCQPFSLAGRRKGITDERWGWPWMRDVVDAVRPRYIIAENVAALLRDVEAFSIILSDLSDLGLDVEWDCVSACSVGAPHLRRRLFLVAHPAGRGQLFGRRVECAQDGDAQRHLHHWAAQPEPHRVADGVPRRVDRNYALGNAVVPQVSEYIGAQLLAAIGAAA